jgi:hypothetical protein
MLAEFSACLFSVSIFCLQRLRRERLVAPVRRCGLRTTRAIGRADLPVPAYGRLTPT